MPRKRSSLLEVEIKEQRRRRIKARQRLRSVLICPKCERETIQLSWKKTKPKYVELRGELVKVKIGHLICTNCGFRETAGLFPAEDLIDLYCWSYDKEVMRQVWLCWSTWLFGHQ